MDDLERIDRKIELVTLLLFLILTCQLSTCTDIGEIKGDIRYIANVTRMQRMEPVR